MAQNVVGMDSYYLLCLSEKFIYSGDGNIIKKKVIKKRFVLGFALRHFIHAGCPQTSLLPSGTAETTALRVDKTQ